MLEVKKKSVKVGQRVSTKHVNDVIRNYKQERWQHNSKRLGKEDSLSVWYSIEELEEFMETCKIHGSEGIRLYFGAYDKDLAPQQEHAGRQTIVLVATKDRETENGLVSKDVYIATENGPSILAYNMGRLCPPFCHNSDFEQIG